MEWIYWIDLVCQGYVFGYNESSNFEETAQGSFVIVDIVGDAILLLLIFISVMGLVLSAAIHLCTILHIYNVPRGVMTFISLGSAIVMYPAIIISKKMCDEAGGKEFRKTIFEVCPKWMSTLTGFLIVYALGGLAFFIFKRYFTGSMVTNQEKGVGVEPDIEVPFDIRFTAGRDIQLERAKDEMVKLIEASQ